MCKQKITNGIVYLLGQRDDVRFYKIGKTTAKTLKRVKELQTGNPDELYVVREFPAKYPYSTEAVMHRRYSYLQVLGEWYMLPQDAIDSFLDECQTIENNFDALSDNPFVHPK